MSQVNVNPPGGGGYYRDDGTAAGVNLLAVVLVIAVLIAIAVVAWGATAGHWFGSTTGNQPGTTVNVSAPARTAPSPGGGITSPAPSR
jgi:predicted metal-binding membrane protein